MASYISAVMKSPLGRVITKIRPTNVFAKKESRQRSTLDPKPSELEQHMEKANNMAEVATLILVAKSILNSLIIRPLHEAQELKEPVSKIIQKLVAAEKSLSSYHNHMHTTASEIPRSWVIDVSKALYEASDLVDEAAADLEPNLHDRSLFGRLCRRSSSNVGPEITRLCQKFTQLENEAPIARVLDSEDQDETPELRKSLAKLGMGLLVWKDADKKDIVIDLLNTTDLKEDLSAVSILGSKHAGKTSIAKSIYNDEKITNHFDLKLWVDASDKFDIDRVLKAIIFSSCSPTSSDIINESELKQMKDLLIRAITGNLLLLVLDHVEELSLQEWHSLRSLLKGCARGSKILVTTRSKQVAKQTCRHGHNIHRLEGLNKKGFLDLIKQLYPSDAQDFEAILNMYVTYYIEATVLEWILILACLLKKTFDPLKREYIGPRDAWNTTKPHNALMLSYNFLNIPLKACFAYCSLFPEDYEIKNIDLISLWMAQGYIEPSDSLDLEDVANHYIETLIDLHFFMPEPKDIYGNIRTCKIHRFIREIAVKVAQGWETKIHLSLIPGRDDSKLDVSNSTRLHSLLHWTTAPQDHDVGILGMNFRSLRVLDLHAFGLRVLPDSIANLIHIRYLDLSHNISLQKLPNSISNLHHLETLKLDCCYELGGLPTTFGKLVNLRRLEINGCENLICMPPGFENLSSLRMLSRYVVGRPHRQSSSGFVALGNLIHLRERLMIELSDNWASTANEAKESNLSNKVKLNQLEIKWEPTNKANASLYKLLLDGLQPPTNLQKLQIEGYRGDDFPSWAKGNNLSTSLPYLIYVSIDGCGKCETLPCFSGLPNLKRLSLRFMGDVKYFESSTSESPFFPVLEELTLHSFYNLERWWKEEKQVQPAASFSHLLKLKIWSCPKLTSMPSCPKVEVLDMQYINEKLLEFHKVRENPHNLKTMLIKNCLHLNNLALVQSSNELEKLVVERLDMLKTMTEALDSHEHLIELEIAGCKDLDLSLGECPESCGTCKKCKAPWKSLSNLQRLTLKELPKLVKLPAGLRCVKTLKFLCISRCNNFKELPEFVSSLTSLQHLRLEGCPALKMLPQGLKEINCLVKVDILECPLLMERCRSGGEDWDKIRHARVLCHRSWRYALMSEAELLSQKPKAKERNVVVHSEDPTIHVDVTVKRQVA